MNNQIYSVSHIIRNTIERNQNWMWLYYNRNRIVSLGADVDVLFVSFGWKLLLLYFCISSFFFEFVIKSLERSKIYVVVIVTQRTLLYLLLPQHNTWYNRIVHILERRMTAIEGYLSLWIGFLSLRWRHSLERNTLFIRQRINEPNIWSVYFMRICHFCF